MVGRVALATSALFLILVVVTPHLVLGHGRGGRKPRRTYRPFRRPARHHRHNHHLHPHKPAAVVPRKPIRPRRPVPVVVPPQPIVPAQPVPVVVPPQPIIPAQPVPVVVPPQPIVPAVPVPVVVPPQPIIVPAGPVSVGPGADAGKGNGEGIKHHGGPLFSGEVNLSILFYGQWDIRHKDLIISFINSLQIPGSAPCKWKEIVESYSGRPITFRVESQLSDDRASLGKVLFKDFIKMLVEELHCGKPNSVAVILAHKDVGTSALCRGKCYDHGSFDGILPYLLVANPEIECPGVCGLPFANPSFGPPCPVFKPPNGDMGVDATIINLAAGLASVVTNPLHTGFSKPGPKTWPIEAGNACEANFGKLTTDIDGVGYNAVGENNLKFVLPAIWNPISNSCWAPM